jgi:hypothetical protein
MDLWTMIFSGVGALGAVAAAWIAWLVFKAQKSADIPAVTIDLLPRQPDGWIEMIVVLQNRDEAEWRLEALTITRPRGVKAVSYFDIPRATKGVPWNAEQEIAALDLAKLTASPKPRLRVMPAGTRGQSMIVGTSDKHHERFSVLLPSPRPKKLSIRLSLVSNDAVQRRTTIATVRELPAPTSKATS